PCFMCCRSFCRIGNRGSSYSTCVEIFYTNEQQTSQISRVGKPSVGTYNVFIFRVYVCFCFLKRLVHKSCCGIDDSNSGRQSSVELFLSIVISIQKPTRFFLIVQQE